MAKDPRGYGDRTIVPPQPGRREAKLAQHQLRSSARMRPRRKDKCSKEKGTGLLES